MKVGIVGGGQLGMMLAESVKDYDMEIIGLDPNSNCPLSFIASKMIIGNYNDPSKFQELIELVDVVTYEFENVDLKLINKYKNVIPQKDLALLISRERLIEKNFAKKLQIPTPYFEQYHNTYEYKGPIVLKTNTGGYDGKGQFFIRNRKELMSICLEDKVEYIIEEIIDFDYEISVIATRDQFDSIAFYPIPINKHINGILFTSITNRYIDKSIVDKALSYTSRIIKELDYVGTMAVEFFVKGTDVIFNEFAPRPHNSGHYTIEGCNVSQFENHMRAISGLKIIEPKLVEPTMMINVLGQNINIINYMYDENMYVHMYNKSEVKHNRKMGHITITKSTEEELIILKKMIVEDL